MGNVWSAAYTPIERYTDKSWENVISHFLFIFGLIPQFSIHSGLPDWSIGLEMQFYAAFPFIMLLFRRFGAQKTSAVLIVLCAGIAYFFNDFCSAFILPSFLPLKLYMFVCGMLLAYTPNKAALKSSLVLCLIAATGYIFKEHTLTSFLRFAMIGCVFYLLGNKSLPEFKRFNPFFERMRNILGGRTGYILGELSYSVYLLHSFVLLIVLGTGARSQFFVELPGIIRFLIGLAIIIPVTYLISFAFYYAVEKPGIAAGKMFVNHFRSSKHVLK